MTTPFYRVRFVIRATRDVVVPGQPGGMLYALLCRANETADQPAAFPRDLMLDAPERTRTLIRQGDLFAFGGTILAGHPREATNLIERLLGRLEILGREGKPLRRGLGGNFIVERCEDLVSGENLTSDCVPIDVDHLNGELERVLEGEEWTLRFLSPMRLKRFRAAREDRRSFFDDRYFDLRVFLRKQLGRLQSLGVQLRDPTAAPELDTSNVAILENRLVWLDMAYGGNKDRMTLGGVCGRLRIRVADPVLRAALVWGQYARIGKNTSFGFGRYRIEELGPEPFACERSVSLLDLAWRHPELDQLAAASGLDAGVLTQALQELATGGYEPDRCARVEFGEGEKRRMLQVPSRRDRVLQRAVLDTIGPGLDQLFESSSYAWRRGLGRHSSAKAIKRAYGQGYQFAVKADFDRFFDSIPHAHLFDKLDAYLSDADACELIRLWVVRAVGGNTGIPTGAPISPLLGNLMLDRFDEQISQQGGRLVRYGDDFLILCRHESQAEDLLAAAHAEAAELEMRLNSGTESPIDLSEPFNFLGFRFERTDRWRKDGEGRPRRLEELGWFDAAKKPPPRRVRLPGETGQPANDFGLTAIVGPGATNLEVQANEVRCHYARGGRVTAAPISELETLVVLGSIGLPSQVVRRLTDSQTNVVLADDYGQVLASITGDYEASPEAVVSQVDARRSTQQTLAIARELVAAKLHNYARLAAAVQLAPELAQRLEDLAARAREAVDLNAIRGVEGAGAALWFGRWGRALGNGFRFERRVAPDARDPVNVLLNIASSLLYRLTVLAIRAAGLHPGLGFLHAQTGRFQSLASDLQEPFRFLMDRTVIEASEILRQRDFRRTDDGPYALAIAPAASRQFQRLLWRNLYAACQVGPDGEPLSYLVHLQRQARRLRRSLVSAEAAFQAFRLP